MLSTISRTTTVRLLPPRLAGAISGEMTAHSCLGKTVLQTVFWTSAFGQIAGIAQFAAVITTAVLTRPHSTPPAKPCLSQGFTSDSKDSRCFEIET